MSATLSSVLPTATTVAIRPLSELGLGDVPLAGGKGANLGELRSAGFPVPDGFVVTAAAFLAAMDAAGIREALTRTVLDASAADPGEVEVLAERARDAIRRAGVPEALAAEVREAWTALADRTGDSDLLVAVRSSATAEDTADTSFAGMNASFTNVTSDDLIDRVLDCWISLYGDRVVAYRAERTLTDEPAIAAVVQVMAPAQRAGVMFTSADGRPDPTADIVIEGAFGLGEFVVAGTVEPDTYRVVREGLAIRDIHIGHKDAALVTDAHGQHTETLAPERARARVLTDDEIVRVARLGLEIEAHYGVPQDIEWVFVGDDLFVVQSRPITFGADSADEHRVLLRGLGVGPNRASGRVRILTSPKQGKELIDGEVLVAHMTSPDWAPTMRRASAIVTDAGGSTCHAAIVSREFGIPGVVGTSTATTTLRTGDVVTVDAASGQVFAGELPGAIVSHREVPGGVAMVSSLEPLATKIYVNLAIEERADEVAALPVDGVGLLRGEFLVTQALDGRHPRALIAEGRSQDFVDRMAAALGHIAGAFAPRPVVYRTMDFRTNEFRHLDGGEEFEPHEENPMIGFRGCYRYVKDPETFALELDALAAARRDHPNLHVMIPFVRTRWELAECLAAIDASPLGGDRSLRRWVMAEVPSIVYRIPEYAAMGIDGVSIGSNDLTQLMLGVDRDSETCAELFDAHDDAVMWAIERIIDACKTAGITSSLCGQAPSDSPAFAEFLVRAGIDSISVNPDAVDQVRATVGTVEKRMLLDAARQAMPGSAR